MEEDPNRRFPLKLFLLTLTLLGSFSIETLGQDALFSQQSMTPLMLNPALSGADAKYRGFLNYRTQWKQVGDPFRTAAASFDMALGKSNGQRQNSFGKPGVGINFLTDRSGDPQLRETQLNMHGSYHVLFSSRSTFGAGFSVGLNSMSLEESSGKWGNQYNNGKYDPNAPHGEDLASLSQSHIDLGGGIIYKYQEDRKSDRSIQSITAGAAFFHAGQLQLNDEVLFTDRRDIRWTGFVSTEIDLANTSGAFLPAAYYHRQGSSQMILFGSYYKYYIFKGSSFQGTQSQAIAMGVFYRWDDAVIAKALYEWGGFAAGISYDVNISELSRHSSSRGAAEIALSYSISEKSTGR